MRVHCQLIVVFFFQAEDGIRYLVRSRGLGDVYKRQGYNFLIFLILLATLLFANFAEAFAEARGKAQADSLLSLIHI